MAKAIESIPLSKLKPSAANVRKTDARADIEELAASIDAHGLLQNLSVRKSANGGGKANEAYEVVAGARRLAALKLLAKRRRIDKDVPVPCKVLKDDDPVEVSLAENVVRVPLHPADQFDAFLELHKQGHGAEAIAARFGVSPTVVLRRLKLAGVSPKLVGAYRAGKMTLEQLMAFTVSDDHAAQERFWEETPYHLDPQTIRRSLTAAHVAATDRRARFIGIEAYEAAGGAVVRDLFQEDDEGYLTDVDLLDRLVAEKLETVGEEVMAEGWSWVEVIPQLDYAYYGRFERIHPHETPLSGKDKKSSDKLQARYDRLIEKHGESPPEKVMAQLQDIQEKLDAIVEASMAWHDDERTRAGAIVTIDYQGSPHIERGLLKPDQVTETGPSKRDKKTSRKSNGKEKPTEPTLPDALREELSAHRTAALREVLAGAPEVALTALLHTLVLRTFFQPQADICVDVRPVIVDLRASDEQIGESGAVAAMSARHQAWGKRLPSQDKLWAWLVEQELETKLDLLAYCTATAVNAVSKRHGGMQAERLEQADAIAAAVQLDMADWWKPTAANYLGKVTKPLILSAVSEAVSKQAADNIAAMKKAAMAARAEELLAETRWLPEPLRIPQVPAQPGK